MPSSSAAGLPEGATPKETRTMLARALNAGAFTEAIPLLEQLITWFKTSKKPSYRRDCENYRFQLGLCHYLLGQFPLSEKRFKEYLKKHRKGTHAPKVAVYLADGYRFTGKLKQAVKSYDSARKEYRYDQEWQTDIRCSLARCFLAEEDWKGAIKHLAWVYENAPDEQRADWAVTLLTVGYLKEGKLKKVYKLVPYLMNPESLAARSIAFNLAALETADILFGEERYRDALWIYRLIYPKKTVARRSKRHVRVLRNEVEDIREFLRGHYRELLRAQERLAESEAELKSLEKVPEFGTELRFRVARSYMEIRRFREARALFLYLRIELDEESAEQPLYLAFSCSTQLQPWDKAFEIGHEYMEAYPGGAFYDTVSISVGQMYAMQRKWPLVISTLTKALEVSPQHESIAECMFLIGYASFMEEKYKDAIKWLGDLNTKYPNHDRIEESTYWLGMAKLFDSRYKEAFAIFDQYIVDYPNAGYCEDATFRRAVCQYGLSQFREAEGSLIRFAEKYSQSKLLGEVFMMLADVHGNFGELEKAVASFQKAIDCGEQLNIELYNYCCFRRGEMFNDMEAFEDIVGHFEAYIDRNREGSNLPMAIYWVSRAQWQLGRQKDAMDYLLKSVVTYGKDRKALGIDMLLQEWVSRSKSLGPKVSEEAWRQLGQLRAEVRKTRDRTLILRLEHIFLFCPSSSDEGKALTRRLILRPEAVEYAAPTVLEYIMDEAHKDGNLELAAKAARTIVQDFTETDYVIGARMLLAELAIEQEEYYTAEKHLNVIREVFASSGEAAKALIMLGNMYLKQNSHAKADRCFKDVLGVREWRGPLWPEALYGRGECARSRHDYRGATQFYERLYVLYGHHKIWVAKAYVARAECLLRMHESRKAREVLNEMLANEDLAGMAETKRANELLEVIKKRGG